MGCRGSGSVYFVEEWHCLAARTLSSRRGASNALRATHRGSRLSMSELTPSVRSISSALDSTESKGLPMSRVISLNELNEAARPGGPSALTSRTRLRPAGGQSASISPAKYTSRSGATYVYEDRFIDDEKVRTVLIDARSSSANRLEDALAQAILDGHPLLSRMPSVRVSYDLGDGQIETYCDYELPHRLVDAHVRLGSVDGQPVTGHEPYRAARNSTLRDLGAVLALSPVSVLFGLWDSTRKARQLRIPSSVVGEIIGVVGDARETRRSG